MTFHSAQHDVLARSSSTFTLEVLDNTPLLYFAVDDNLKLQGQSGTTPVLGLFQVDVELVVQRSSCIQLC